MKYSAADTPILSSGTVSAEAIQAWIAEVGKGYAPSFAPDRVYKAPPPDLGRAIVDECRRYPQIVNYDMVAAQIVHETAGWQSRYARERNNPGGIGAINSNPDLAVSFPTVAAGVRAHVAHLLVYAVGDGPWSADDPRRDAVRRVGWLGAATHWSDLNGKWAYPGTTYGQQIATLANRLVTFANDGSWGQPVAGDDNRFEWLEEQAGEFGYPPGTRGRNGFAIELGVLHITIGNDSLAYLRGGNGNSAHYLTDKLMRPRAQMIRESDAAWTGGHREYNLRGIHIEGEKRNVSDPWTDEMYANLAETCYPISKRNNLPLVYLGRDNGTGKRGWIGHSDIPDPDGSGWGGAGNHTDPGENFDWPRFIALMRGLDTDSQPIPDGPPAMPQTVPDPRGSGFWIPKPFLERIAQDDWMNTGVMLSEAFIEGNQIVQYSERRRFELNGDGSVTLGLVGAEVLYSRYPDRIP